MGSCPIVLAVGGRITRADIPGLCERARGALEATDADVVTCDVAAVAEPDAVTVDALARLQLTALRQGCTVRFRHVGDELHSLITVMGLGGVLVTAADRDASRSRLGGGRSGDPSGYAPIMRRAARVFPLAKELAYRLRVNLGFFPRYPYMYSPAQLAFLCQCVSDVEQVDGAIVEVGSAFGNTTVFLNEHMRCSGIERRYVCIDTFSGFTERDLQDEVSKRGRRPPARAFRTNKQKWVQRTLDVNKATGVTLHEADAAVFDYGEVGPVAFCLIDVDLYLPVRSVLDRVFDLVPRGGRIVVDDCGRLDRAWEGAYQAYREFVEERGLAPRIVLDKLGVIDK